MIKDISKIDKQLKLYEKIKKIEADITKLDKMASLVNDGATQKIRLTVLKPATEEANHTSNKTTEEKCNCPMCQLEAITSGFRGFSFSIGKEANHTSDKTTEVFETDLNDILTFEVLGIILQKKTAIRDSLIKQINEM